VVGYPIHMDGTVGLRAKEVDVFIGNLEKNLALPVHRVDERLTSLAAEEALGSHSFKKKKKNLGRIDASAAGLILRDFIENRKVIPPPNG
jgi:putative Holliday junction resolvase